MRDQYGRLAKMKMEMKTDDDDDDDGDDDDNDDGRLSSRSKTLSWSVG